MTEPSEQVMDEMGGVIAAGGGWPVERDYEGTYFRHLERVKRVEKSPRQEHNIMVDLAGTHSFQVEPGRYLDSTSLRSVTLGMTRKKGIVVLGPAAW